MLEILKGENIVATIRPGQRFYLPEEKQVIFNVQIDTEIPGHTIREQVIPEPPEPPEPTPEERKAQLAAHAANLRWQKEVGGAEWNSWPIHTDRESQAKIIAERLAIEAGERTDPDGWKFADGAFRMVSNADFVALSNAVRGHVRDCYATEATVLAQIEAGLITSESEIESAYA